MIQLRISALLRSNRNEVMMGVDLETDTRFSQSALVI